MRYALAVLFALWPAQAALACSCVAPQDIRAVEQREGITRVATGAALIGEFEVLAEPKGDKGAGGRLRPVRVVLGASPKVVRVAATERMWSGATCDTDLPPGRRLWLILFRPERRWPQDQALARSLHEAERRGDETRVAQVRREVAHLHRRPPRTYRPLGLCEQYLLAPRSLARILTEARRLGRKTATVAATSLPASSRP